MMNRIVLHHTGGGYAPSHLDLRAYHRLIDGDGAVHPGQHPIEANAPGQALHPGRYAAHTRGLNTGAIGVSVCAMANAQWRDPFGSTRTPVAAAQVDGLIREVARLCVVYGIRPERRFVLTHAEVQTTLGVEQRGKWDFDYHPRNGGGPRDPIAIGDDLRSEVVREIARLHMPLASPTAPRRPTIRQGSEGPHVRALQQALGIVADGIFGPKTAEALRRFQVRNQLLPDAIAGPMTWAALARQS